MFLFNKNRLSFFLSSFILFKLVKACFSIPKSNWIPKPEWKFSLVTLPCDQISMHLSLLERISTTWKLRQNAHSKQAFNREVWQVGNFMLHIQMKHNVQTGKKISTDSSQWVHNTPTTSSNNCFTNYPSLPSVKLLSCSSSSSLVSSFWFHTNLNLWNPLHTTPPPNNPLRTTHHQ